MKKFLISTFLILILSGIILAATACSATSYTIAYIAGEGGNISGKTVQTVEKNKNGVEVTAIANDGYIFTHWSDGETNPTRQDKNIQENLSLTAAFAKIEGSIELTVNYKAGEDGYINEGETHSILYGQSLTVTAKAEDGYEFMRWSDGKTDAKRIDNNIKAGFTVTAIFDKSQEPVYIEIRYIAGDGGYIDEDENHTIIYGQSLTVTAKAEDGYSFVKWSDGIETAKRNDEDIKAGFTVTALFAKEQQPTYIEVKYKAGEGGYIDEGENHTIIYGQSLTVTAKAEDGYSFVKWSDGIETAERNDEDIKAEFNVIAIFNKISKTFNYVYNNATDNNTEKSIIVNYNSLYKTIFIVPIREHFSFIGWFLDDNFQTQITDEQGNIMIGYEIFDNASNSLYAKFIAKEELVYKILMVFVTETHAVLSGRDGNSHIVDYIMSPIEREILELFPNMVAEYLNEMVDGLVSFDVETYFTTIPIGSESFERGTTSSGMFSYSVKADKIPEVGKKLDDYRSIITTFGMSDYNGIIHSGAGGANKKYASVYIEGLFGALIKNNESLETRFNFTDTNVLSWWKFHINTYLHEFTHTIEMYSRDFYEFHAALKYYYAGAISTDKSNEAIKLYLLNQLDIEGEKIGVAYGFWKDDIHYTLNYSAAEGGTINGNTLQHIRYSGNSERVTAVPDEGYKFVKWSDGYTYAERSDAGATNVTAIFEEISRLFWYYINNGDDGMFIIINYHSLHKSIFMVPEMEGFVFGGWYLGNFEIQVSDGAGNAIIGQGLFELPPQYGYLHPKWIPITEDE